MLDGLPAGPAGNSDPGAVAAEALASRLGLAVRDLPTGLADLLPIHQRVL